jgi:hypothetical protein
VWPYVLRRYNEHPKKKGLTISRKGVNVRSIIALSCHGRIEPP